MGLWLGITQEIPESYASHAYALLGVCESRPPSVSTVETSPPQVSWKLMAEEVTQTNEILGATADIYMTVISADISKRH